MFIEWIEEWSQLAPGYNWRTFHPLMLEVEDDRHMGGWEFTVIVLGLGLRFRHNYTETDDTRKITRMVADIDKP